MELNQHIEHTLLKPDAVNQEIVKLCNEAVENNFFGVCVPPYFLQLAKKTIRKNDVKLVTVVGFPLGYDTVSSKVEAAKKAIISGAQEVDMVMNISAFKSGDYAYVQNDIQSVVTVCHLSNIKCKVIIETCYLTNQEIEMACKICADSEADFVKTSTGFGTAGATVDHVKLMRKVLPARVKIKASGGIKSKQMALDLIKAGASRLGCSASMAIINEA
jgi:deoxyribose-phosphate aldolase